MSRSCAKKRTNRLKRSSGSGAEKREALAKGEEGKEEGRGGGGLRLSENGFEVRAETLLG